MNQTDTLIIGAGPAGLATGARLRQLGLAFTLIERSDHIADAWHRHYDRLCLHTVKQLSHLPLLPFPDHYPMYVPRLDLINYFEDYSAQFELNPQLNMEAERIERQGDQWLVHLKGQSPISAKQVVVATGLNRVPYRPQWPYMDQYNEHLIHSRVYQNPSPYQGKRVLVVGMGNTGAEIALDLSEKGVATTLSVRGEVNIVPRDVMGRPVQLTGKMLEKLPFGMGDWIGKQTTRMVVGNMKAYGLQTSKLTPAEQLRTTGKTPVIDLGTIAHIKAGKIQVRPGIERFTEEGVVFTDGKEEAFEAVIMATGYRAALEDWLGKTDDLLDSQGYPKSPIGTGSHQGLYFVGFDNYKLGGILGTIATDSAAVAQHIQAHSSTLHPTDS